MPKPRAATAERERRRRAASNAEERSSEVDVWLDGLDGKRVDLIRGIARKEIRGKALRQPLAERRVRAISKEGSRYDEAISAMRRHSEEARDASETLGRLVDRVTEGPVPKETKVLIKGLVARSRRASSEARRLAEENGLAAVKTKGVPGGGLDELFAASLPPSEEASPAKVAPSEGFKAWGAESFGAAEPKGDPGPRKLTDDHKAFYEQPAETAEGPPTGERGSGHEALKAWAKEGMGEVPSKIEAAIEYLQAEGKVFANSQGICQDLYPDGVVGLNSNFVSSMADASRWLKGKGGEPSDRGVIEERIIGVAEIRYERLGQAIAGHDEKGSKGGFSTEPTSLAEAVGKLGIHESPRPTVRETVEVLRGLHNEFEALKPEAGTVAELGSRGS